MLRSPQCSDDFRSPICLHDVALLVKILGLGQSKEGEERRE